MSMIRVGTPSVSSMCVISSSVPRSASRYGSTVDPWLPTWKLKPREADPGGQHVLDDQFRLGGVDAELRRQIRFRRRIAERETHQDVDVGGQVRELLRLDGVVDDERAHARDVGVVDVGRASSPGWC